MKKSDLINKLQKKFSFLNKNQISDITEIVFHNMSEALLQKKRIEIRGFGAFSLRKRKVQKSFPSQLEEKITFKEKNTVYFRMGKEFFKHLNSNNE